MLLVDKRLAHNGVQSGLHEAGWTNIHLISHCVNTSPRIGPEGEENESPFKRLCVHSRDFLLIGLNYNAQKFFCNNFKKLLLHVIDPCFNKIEYFVIMYGSFSLLDDLYLPALLVALWITFRRKVNPSIAEVLLNILLKRLLFAINVVS